MKPPHLCRDAAMLWLGAMGAAGSEYFLGPRLRATRMRMRSSNSRECMRPWQKDIGATGAVVRRDGAGDDQGGQLGCILWRGAQLVAVHLRHDEV